MRLLIAEDDTKLSHALARGLRAEGYAVDVAATGDEALLQARVYDYDALILDVMMPGPDGIAVCDALRREGRWAPVLMLTARDGANCTASALDSVPRTRSNGDHDPRYVGARSSARTTAVATSARPRTEPSPTHCVAPRRCVGPVG